MVMSEVTWTQRLRAEVWLGVSNIRGRVFGKVAERMAKVQILVTNYDRISSVVQLHYVPWWLPTFLYDRLGRRAAVREVMKQVRATRPAKRLHTVYEVDRIGPMVFVVIREYRINERGQVTGA